MPNMVESFEAIEEAVLESPRGRWFLAEYASRLRSRESAAIVGQITALEAAVTSNHDAIMARIAQALAQPPGGAAASQPQADLAPRHMKFFKQDEDIFEPAQKPLNIVKAAPEEKRGAKLTITRMGAAAPEPAAVPPAETAAPEAPQPEPQVAAAAEPPAETAAVAEAPPAPSLEAAPEEAPKRRIVIIRHKPGEAITVPLQNEAPAAEPELAEAG